MNRKFTTTEEVLIAMEGAQRAKPDADFISRMETMALSYVQKEPVSMGWIFSIAASFVLLLSINFYGMSLSDNETSAGTVDTYATILNPSKDIYDE